MQPLYVVVAGTLAQGLNGRAVLELDAAFTLVGELQVEGLFAEALLLEDPSAERKVEGFRSIHRAMPAACYPQDRTGKYIVLFGDVVQGLKAVGPFPTEDTADEFGENHPRDALDPVVYSVITVETDE